MTGRSISSLAWAGCVLLGAATLGCAPTFSQLVEHKHYREALCAAVEEDYRDEVADALSLDADLHLHVHRVEHEELERAIGFDGASEVGKRAEFVRVRFQSNAIPVDGYGVKVWFEGDARGGVQSAPVDWKSLAFATGERLPPKVYGKRYDTGENLLIGTAAVFTVGFSFLFTGWFKPRTVASQAPRSEFLRYAPLATALHDEMTAELPCSPFQSKTHQSKRCEQFFVLDSGTATDWSLHVEQAFAANRIPKGEYDDDEVCRVSTTDTVPIGPTARDTRSVFARRMTPLSDLASDL